MQGPAFCSQTFLHHRLPRTTNNRWLFYFPNNFVVRSEKPANGKARSSQNQGAARSFAVPAEAAGQMTAPHHSEDVATPAQPRGGNFWEEK